MISQDNTALVLLSGGVDSAALAAIVRPAATLFVDYGQRPARAEGAAARVVSAALGLVHVEVGLNLSSLGGGLLLDEKPLENAPSPEWWPFRNQFLATAGAAIAVKTGASKVLLASVLGDGRRHVDGTAGFYESLSKLTSMQEGEIVVSAPAIHLSTQELVRASGLGPEILGWTVSCHRSDFACHACPGCYKREQVMKDLGLHENEAAEE